MSAWFARTLIFVLASGLIASPARADQSILDDMVAGGSACIGAECANGEVFGFETMILKDSAPRITFQDTSGTGAFPSSDWQIVANDSEEGGEEFFGITSLADAVPGTCEGGLNDGSACGIFLPSCEELRCQIPEGPNANLNGQIPCADDPAVCADFEGTCETIPGTCVGETLPGPVFRIGAGAPSDSLRVEPDGELSVGGALDVAGDIELSGTVDGRDIAADGIVLDSLANATGPNLTSIQADISALQTGLGTAQGDIGTLQTGLGTAQGDIGTLQTGLGTAQGDVGTLQTDLGTAQGDIGTLQTDLGTAQGDIGTLDTSLGDAESDVGTLQTDLVALQGLVGTVQGDVANHLGDTDNPHGVTAEQAGVADRRAARGTGSAGPWVGILRANEFARSKGQPWVAQVVFDSPVTAPYVVSLTNVTTNARKALRSAVSGKSADGFTVSVIRDGFEALEEINWVVIPLS